MSLKEKLIYHIQNIIGNPNADLWTLKFNEKDINATRDQIDSHYIQGIPIRTNEEISKDAYSVLSNQ